MGVPFYNDFVVVNKYSRPAYKLLSVKGIVIHYTANPSATAENHQDFFDGADGGGSRYAGAHIFVDKDSAVCIIPLNEVGYHANEKPSKLSQFKATASYYKGGNANLVTIGIEMCIEKDGSFHPNTVKRTQEIVKYLMALYKVPVSNVVRHYDVTGKNCPKPYVENPKAWTAFKAGLKPKPVAPAKSKLLTVTVGELFTYKSPNWNDKGVIVKKGDVFTVVQELMVSGSKMYKLKSGLYITANPKYVSVK